MEHDETTATNGSRSCRSSGPSPEPLQIRVGDGEREATMPGQRTVCPHLVVVPLLDGGSYTGTFSLAHVPTGTVLRTAEEDHLTPELARYAAAQLVALDWTSDDLRTYQGSASTNRHVMAWLTALSAAQDLRWYHAASEIPAAVEAAEIEAAEIVAAAAARATTRSAR